MNQALWSLLAEGGGREKADSGALGERPGLQCAGRSVAGQEAGLGPSGGGAEWEGPVLSHRELHRGPQRGDLDLGSSLSRRASGSDLPLESHLAGM